MSPLWYGLGPLTVAFVVVIAVLLIRPAPYLTYTPGSARPVEPIVEVRRGSGPDAPVVTPEKADDDLLFVTVTVSQVPGIQVLLSLRDRTAEVTPREAVYGTQTADENRRFNMQLMTDSKDVAAAVAMRRAGYPVKIRDAGAVVMDLDPKYPVAEVVDPGDTITRADGRPVRTAEDLVSAIRAHRPGQTISLRVKPFGDSPARTVRTRLREHPRHKGRAQLGVTPQTRTAFTLPMRVDIKSGKVGGPSAGLAFTLAILDRITPGDLLGDQRVAVTGTIAADGSVGPVGGVVQKTEAAVRAGAKVFLVPPDEYRDARGTAGGRLRVERVASLEEALRALRRNGGDPVPERRPDR